MLKFLDKPITWKGYILLGLTITVVTAVVRTARDMYEEYQFNHDYFDIEEDNPYDED